MQDGLFSPPNHFWLGYAQKIQGYVEREVVIETQQIRTQKVAEPNVYGYTDEQWANIRSETEKWQFLFQIDTDDSLNVMWGDVGTLYVCIPKADLAARRFDDAWTVEQGA